jgi:hypothetical protein
MNSFGLDTPLLSVKNGAYKWSIRDSVQGTAIFGGIGSGKTSAVGAKISTKMLAAGYGGLVLCAKHDEVDLWRSYCEKAGRLDDLIIVNEQSENYFNLFDYEFENSASRRVATDNLVEVLSTIIRSGDEKSQGRSDDRFWSDALNLLLYNLIDLCILANDGVTVKDMYEIMASLPKANHFPPDKSQKIQETLFVRTYNRAQQRVNALVEEWREKNADSKNLEQEEFNEVISFHIPEARTLRYVYEFFQQNFLPLAEKTKSIITYSCFSFLGRFMRDPVYSIFNKHKSNFTPDDCSQGKIIVLDFPVKKYHRAGRDVQTLFKLIWQRAMEKRKVDDDTRPVFLWADEAQHFLHEHDSEFQATARSSRIATVYISQNLSNYYTHMGGSNAEHRVKSFLGTLSTKFFLANADVDTNEYASQLCGDGFFYTPSENENFGNESFGFGKGWNFQSMRAVRPEEFIKLKSGGPENNFDVEAYMHVQGRPIFDNKNFYKVTFNQKQ